MATTAYQRDSSSKRPRSSVAVAVHSARVNVGRWGLDNRSFHISLVIYAAVGIMIVMVSATVFHIARGETSSAAITLVLFGIAAFVAYARHRVVPVAGRGTTGNWSTQST